MLASLGALATVGLAGCGSDGGGDGAGGTTAADGDDGDAAGVSVDDYPSVDAWLTGGSAGGADGTYDGSLVDRTGTDSISVAVGSSGNGANFGYDPSAVAVSEGTEVVWEWTGKGNRHNVVADTGQGAEATDVEFTSGDAVDSADKTFTRAFDESGVALYHCTPHLSVGMKGAVVVV